MPGMKYYYKFGDAFGWSEEASFHAAPQPGPDVITRVLAFGGRDSLYEAAVMTHAIMLLKLLKLGCAFVCPVPIELKFVVWEYVQSTALPISMSL